MGRNVSPWPCHQLTLLQATKVTKPRHQRSRLKVTLSASPMELNVVPAKFGLVLSTEAGCSSICSFPSHTAREPCLARAYNLKLREAGFWTLRLREKKFKVRNFSLTGPTPLKLPALLQKSSWQ